MTTRPLYVETPDQAAERESTLRRVAARFRVRPSCERRKERVMVTEDRLRTLLRVAESAHAAYEAERGEPDEDWPAWYAAFIVARFREEPGVATHELLLDDEEHRLLAAAVHAHLDDFGHDEADVLRKLKELYAKIKASS